jgi:division/cell wall cluster transcriptional repressor MraZ
MENEPKIASIGFIGGNKYNIDSKSRVCIPPDFINLLDTKYQSEHRSLVTFISLNRSIAVYPIASYFKFLEDIQQKSILDNNMRSLLNMIQGSSSIQTIDGQNRLRLSEDLLKNSKITSKDSNSENTLTKEVYVKGFVDHFEVWAVDRWDKFIEETIEKVDSISNDLSKTLDK